MHRYELLLWWAGLFLVISIPSRTIAADQESLSVRDFQQLDAPPGTTSYRFAVDVPQGRRFRVTIGESPVRVYAASSFCSRKTTTNRRSSKYNSPIARNPIPISTNRLAESRERNDLPCQGKTLHSGRRHHHHGSAAREPRYGHQADAVDSRGQPAGEGRARTSAAVDQRQATSAQNVGRRRQDRAAR